MYSVKEEATREEVRNGTYCNCSILVNGGWLQTQNVERNQSHGSNAHSDETSVPYLPLLSPTELTKEANTTASHSPRYRR